MAALPLTRRLRCALAAVLIVLAGCVGTVGEKRHTPAEIASYKTSDFVAAIASADGERALVRERSELIRQGLAAPTVADGDEDSGTPGALWAMAFLNADRAPGLDMLQRALVDIHTRELGFQRAVLSAAYTLYAREAAPSLLAQLDRLSTPREYAIAVYAILKADDAQLTRLLLRERLVARFPEWAQEPRLIALEHRLVTDLVALRKTRPPLKHLLAAPFRPGYPVVFSFQRPDRTRVGLAMVRGNDGRFLRNADGSYFHVAHLALALSNLPGTITNGNTPQGLFTIVGAGTATNKLIGPTPYLHSKVPKEASVAEFEHAEVAAEWNAERYASFLPPSWRDYFPFQEAWLAGLAGRDEMLTHGTTINPEYYRDHPYYPGTPSAGCLVAMEYWSKTDGRLVESEQLKLVKAFTAGGQDQGYLVVVELDDLATPVPLAEVVAEIMAAEGGLR